MSSAEPKHLQPLHGIRALLAGALALLLSSCGGAGGQLAGGGIGGTGISSGPITAFGSIVVGGVEYELGPDTQVFRDGRQATQADLALGMVVTVEGSIGTGPNAKGYVPGQATRVDYASDLAGPVEAVDATAGTLRVLGVEVRLSPATVLEPAGLQLQPGDWVEVSGLSDGTGVLQATRIEKKEKQGPAEQELRGLVQGLDEPTLTFRLRGVLVSYATANLQGQLREGMAVKVYGSYQAGDATSPSTFLATRIEADEAHVKARAEERLGRGDGEAELEGLLAGLAGKPGQAGCAFQLDGLAVDCKGARLEDEHGFGLAEGAWVEVEGTLTADAQGQPLLEAEKVEVKAPAQAAAGGSGGSSSGGSGSGGGGAGTAQPFEGEDLVVDARDPQTQTVTATKGSTSYTIRLTPSTVFEDERTGIAQPLNLGTAFTGDAALRPGDRLDVKGYLQGGTVTALRLEVKDPS